MELPNPKDLFKNFLSENALEFTGFTAEGLALMSHYREQANLNPAAPLTTLEVQILGQQLCSEEFGEDFQIIRPLTRNDTGLVWADKNSGYLNEDGVTHSYTKHGLISVFNGQPDVIKISMTVGPQTCYYVFDRATLTVIPERTLIHTTG